MLSLSVSAQTPFIPEGGKKWDGRLDALVAGGTVQRISAKGVQSVTPQTLTGVIINSSEPAVTADFEAYLASSQENVTGRVLIDLKPYHYVLVGVESDFDLMKTDFGEYGEINKAWTADGQVTIVGGRNIGGEYFDARPDVNFRDLDLLLAGPAAQQAIS